MFESIKTFIRNTRIKIDYPLYERAQRAAHSSEADRRFDASQLNKEISQIKQQATYTGDQRFGTDITALRQRVTATENDLRKNRQLLSYFERSYKAELDDLYSQKTQLLEEKAGLLKEAKTMMVERASAHDELQEAYDNLADAKSDVNRWHEKSARSPWLLGNGKKKIPKQAIFGQSHGDLSAAKYRRGVAAYEIGGGKLRVTAIKETQGRIRQEIDRNYAAIGSTMEKIDSIKKDRQHMYDLRKEGVDPTALHATIQTAQSSLTNLTSQLHSRENQRLALIQETQVSLGLHEREIAISNLHSKKARFTEQFESAQSKAIREEEHRQQWMVRHS